MTLKASIYREILREYDSIRDTGAHNLRTRVREVYHICPRIEQIDREISQTGVQIARLVLSKTEQTQSLLGEMKTHMKELKTEKIRLLKANNFPEDFLSPQYQCEKCKDTGYIDNEICSCFHQKLVDKAYHQSNLKKIIQKENFDFFDFRYYSDETDPRENTSPLVNIRNIYNICLKFVENFDHEPANLLLYGNTGLGKTFLCNCIAKDLMDAGHPVLYQTAPQLFKMIEDNRFHRNEDDPPIDYMEDILSVDLLIIDDLGTEFSTVLSSSELFHILNTRLLEKKPVILSTNLSPAMMLDQYSDRIVSRIMGNYLMLKFFGDDIRVKKKFQKQQKS